MKPVCVTCRMFFRPKTNGFAFVEGMPSGAGAPPGNAAPDRWRPYKLWSGDLWECRGCGARIVVGVGAAPRAEHYQPEFAGLMDAVKPELQVNDC